MCRLRGSDLLERLELDKRFVLYFHTVLTWQPVGSGGGSGKGAPPSSASSSSSSSSIVGGGLGSIHAQSEVQVWSEVVGPFRAIPRAALQVGGCGAEPPLVCVC